MVHQTHPVSIIVEATELLTWLAMDVDAWCLMPFHQHV
jgi:hypothetical protein